MNMSVLRFLIRAWSFSREEPSRRIVNRIENALRRKKQNSSCLLFLCDPMLHVGCLALHEFRSPAHCWFTSIKGKTNTQKKLEQTILHFASCIGLKTDTREKNPEIDTSAWIYSVLCWKSESAICCELDKFKLIQKLLQMCFGLRICAQLCTELEINFFFSLESSSVVADCEFVHLGGFIFSQDVQQRKHAEKKIRKWKFRSMIDFAVTPLLLVLAWLCVAPPRSMFLQTVNFPRDTVVLARKLSDKTISVRCRSQRRCFSFWHAEVPCSGLSAGGKFGFSLSYYCTCLQWTWVQTKAIRSPIMRCRVSQKLRLFGQTFRHSSLSATGFRSSPRFSSFVPRSQQTTHGVSRSRGNLETTPEYKSGQTRNRKEFAPILSRRSW